MMIQPFCSEHQLDLDLILNEANREHSGAGFPECSRMWLEKPGFHAHENIRIAYVNDNPAGFISVFIEKELNRVVFSLFVRRGYRDDKTEKGLLEHAFSRAAEEEVLCLHTVISSDHRRQNRLEEQGFKRIRRQLDLEIALKNISEGKGNASISMFRPGMEDCLAAIQNRSFKGSWGFCSNSTEEISYYLSITGSRAEEILFLEDEGRKAGYVWMYGIDRKNRTPVRSRIHMFGIDPRYRKRGWGKLLLNEGLCRLKQLGYHSAELTVDSENEPALRLYESSGFYEKSHRLWFEKKTAP